MIAREFDAGASSESDEPDKISEMRATFNMQQRKIKQLMNDTLFWKTKVLTPNFHFNIVQRT